MLGTPVAAGMKFVGFGVLAFEGDWDGASEGISDGKSDGSPDGTVEGPEEGDRLTDG